MGRFLIIPDINRIDESICLAKENNLGFEYNDFFLPGVLDNSDTLNTLINKYRSVWTPELITSHGDFFDVMVFSMDEQIRKISENRIWQSIEVATRLGAGSVIFHTNYEPLLTAKPYQDNWLTKNTEFFKKVLEKYPDTNIYIENMFDKDPDLIVKLAKELSTYKNFGICLDYAHAFVFGSDIDKWVDMTHSYVKHIHINDNDGRSDLHLPVGKGKIDWEGFKKYYELYFSDCTCLIENSDIESQKESIKFLKGLTLF